MKHNNIINKKYEESRISFKGDLTDKQALTTLSLLILLTGIVEGLPL